MLLTCYAKMTIEDINKDIEAVRDLIPSLMGSACLDEAARMMSLYSFLKEKAISYKQQAYQIANNNKESAAKGENEMKASEPYKMYLLLDLKGEVCREMALILKVKGRDNEKEREAL